MPRPLRWMPGARPGPRRRHRTWMFSMSMATLGWAVLWIDLFLSRFGPELAPSFEVAAWFACAFGLIGFAAAVFGFRARLAWLLMLAIPLFANATLLATPWALSSLELVAERAH